MSNFDNEDMSDSVDEQGEAPTKKAQVANRDL